jgi:hypothetical protein
MKDFIGTDWLKWFGQPLEHKKLACNSQEGKQFFFSGWTAGELGSKRCYLAQLGTKRREFAVPIKLCSLRA